MDNQHKNGTHGPLNGKQPAVCLVETPKRMAGVIEIKQELVIKEESQGDIDDLMLSVSQQHCSCSAIELGVNAANYEPILEDFFSIPVKMEPKAEDDFQVEQKPTEGKGSNENATPKGKGDVQRQPKRGVAAPRSSNGKPKIKGADVKGRAKAVINAAHPKRKDAAKKTKKQHKCTSCDYVTQWPSRLKRHMLKHTGEKPISCNICTRRFTHKWNLQAHLQTHTDEYPLKCPNCRKRFEHDDQRLAHETNCNGRHFECHLCKKFSAPNKTRLKEHMRAHTGERPFGCSLCSKGFKLKAHLHHHYKIHTKPRPVKFQCLVCAQNFSDEMEKNQHESKCKRRRYECYLCNSCITSSKSSMIVHMRVHHTGVKPFRCEMCKKYFTQSTDLFRHVKRNHK